MGAFFYNKRRPPAAQPTPETDGDDQTKGGEDDGNSNRATMQSPCEQELLHELARLFEETPGATEPEPVRYALRFTGEVQFVGFRWTNRMLAEEHGLTGWVENLSDGSVTMELQGPPETVAAHFGRLHADYLRYGNLIWLESAERIETVPDEDGFRVLNAW